MPEEIPSPRRETVAPEDSAATLPVHIGIIMDGNGRWAQQRGKVRTQGHVEGLEAAKRIVKACADIGIRYLTLYAFSTENWKRTAREVSFLMRLIKKHLRKEYDFYRRNRVRVVHSGDLAGLPADVIREIESVSADTARFDGLTTNLAINYGGRDEIVRAVNRFLDTDPAPRRVSEADIRAHLDQPRIPDPDLIIRTGGEFRVSNFLIWELAYAEFFSSPKLWPDWNREDLLEAIRTYQQRERRFGAVRK